VVDPDRGKLPSTGEKGANPFRPEHEGYLVDAAKRERLAAEKLEALATEARREGWKWVEILPTAATAFFAR
jgi:ParB family transcriptional regulator, chromosome partitioning protein